MVKKITVFVIVVIAVITLILTINSWHDQNKIHTLRIATGGKSGEYYAFAQALSKVVTQHNPKIIIKVIETAGAVENQELLEKHQVELAILQSDTQVSSSTRAITLLFPEIFHLIVREDAHINTINDLKGKRLALMPVGSGSYNLFWPLIKHYGLQKNDFTTISLSPEKAYEALKIGKVDALFRVIALGNPSISKLVQSSKIKIIPIDQAAALQLFLPALEPSEIPKGAYNGAIPIPAENLPVVGVRSMLVTDVNIEENIIYEITQILFDSRNEIIKLHSPSAMITRAAVSENFGLMIHPGANSYLSRDKPSFWVEYADSIALLLSILGLTISGLWQLKIWLHESQKNRADKYNLEIIELIERIQLTEDLTKLSEIRYELFGIFKKVIIDLDKDRISQASYESFIFPWETALSTIRHQEMILTNQQSTDNSTNN